jgi:hypothetical protein
MDIVAALRKAEAKLQKQADKARQQLDNVRAAIKILGREVASSPWRKQVCSNGGAYNEDSGDSAGT